MESFVNFILFEKKIAKNRQNGNLFYLPLRTMFGQISP